MTDTAIAPADLDTCLRVIAALDDLPVEHPDAVAVRRATARLFKTVKERRRSERRRAVLEADAAVTAATATAAPGRIDDETQGLPLTAAAAGASAAGCAGTVPRYDSITSRCAVIIDRIVRRYSRTTPSRSATGATAGAAAATGNPIGFTGMGTSPVVGRALPPLTSHGLTRAGFGARSIRAQSRSQ